MKAVWIAAALVLAVVAATGLVFFTDRDATSTPEGWITDLAVRLRGSDPVAVTRDAVTPDATFVTSSGRTMGSAEVFAWIDAASKARRFSPAVSQIVALPAPGETVEALVIGTFAEGDPISTVRPSLSAFRAAVSLVPDGPRFRVRSVRLLP